MRGLNWVENLFYEKLEAIRTGGGGGGGGGAVTIADGSDAAIGGKADAAATTDIGTFSFIALFKRLLQRFTTMFPAALGPTTAASSFSVTLANNHANVPTKETRSTTAAHSNVVASITNVTLLASNVNRLGASIYNDSASILYIKDGATASATSFRVKMAPDSYYEVPFNYTGVIEGIWVSAVGSARVVENV